MNLLIKENKNNISRTEPISNNTNFKNLVDVTIKHRNDLYLLMFIREMFYVKEIEKYEEIFNEYKNDYLDPNFQKIHNIFIKLNLNAKNLSNYRGVFLEALTFKILSELYPNQKICKESKICLDNFESHYFDILVNLEEYINSYECKFSSNYLKRKNIDSMIGLSNKIDNINLFLVFFDFSENIVSSLNMLKGETNPEKYLEMINEFNFVCLDNISNNEAFID